MSDDSSSDSKSEEQEASEAPVKRRKCKSKKNLLRGYVYNLTISHQLVDHEDLFLADLPNSDSYEKSYMHRDIITHVVTTKTDFVVTASVDGHIKFWKKMEEGIEFVKHFRSHLSEFSQFSPITKPFAWIF